MKRTIIIISFIFFIAAVVFTVRQLSKTKITVSAVDAFDNQPINNAVVELTGLVEGYPEEPQPDLKFGKEKTKNGIATFYISKPELTGGLWAFEVEVSAEGYLEIYDIKGAIIGPNDFFVRLIPKEKSIANTEKLAIEYAKRNRWVAYWIEKHPRFNPDNSENRKVSLDSPYWWVTFHDQQWKDSTIDCSKVTWDPRDIRCTIAAKVNALDGNIERLQPDDIADTEWAPSYGL